MWCSLRCPRWAGTIKAGDACAVVESVKTANDIYSPVSGEVTEANPLVVADPALVNSDPYTAGWFYKIKLSNPAELNALLSAASNTRPKSAGRESLFPAGLTRRAGPITLRT